MEVEVSDALDVAYNSHSYYCCFRFSKAYFSSTIKHTHTHALLFLFPFFLFLPPHFTLHYMYS